MSRRYVGPWTYGLKVQSTGTHVAEFGITQVPSTSTMKQWLHSAMVGEMSSREPDPPEDAWLPSNTQEVIWQGQTKAFWYKAGRISGRRYYDLTAAVADMPEKDVAKAEKVLKTFLRLVDRAEGRGLTLRKKHAKLSTKDAQKIRRKVKASFLRWANS